MLQFFYRNASNVTTEMTSRIDRALITGGWTTNAEQGSVATSTLLIDDPNGDFNIGGHVFVFMNETEATNQRIYTGFVADRKVRRMNPAVSAARVWEVTLTDSNTTLHRPIFHATADNRSPETDVHRVLYAANYLDAVNTSLVSTASPVDMDEADYRGQYLSDAIDDCAQQSGKNYYIRDGKTSGTWLVYNDSSTSTLTSTLRISNVLADVDSSTTWAASADTELVRDPSRVFSGIWMPYNGGAVYRSLQSTATAFAIRDTVSQAVNVKTSTKANSRADRMLADIASEEDVITTTIWVTASHVNDAMAGDLISCKFSHLPGYESFSNMRILNRTVLPLIPNDTQPYEYQITFTLSSQSTAASGSPSCANQIGSLEYSTYSVVTSGSVQSVPGATPVGYPAVVFVSALPGTGTSLVTSGGFTTLGGTKTGGGVLSSGDYKAVSAGSPGSATYTWTGSTGCVSGSSIAIRTASTTPVQSVEGTISPVSLSSAPTVGNILVATRQFAVLGGGTSPPINSSSWTQYAGSAAKDPGSASYAATDILVRCVTADDVANHTYNLSEGQQFNAFQISEWSIT